MPDPAGSLGLEGLDLALVGHEPGELAVEGVVVGDGIDHAGVLIGQAAADAGMVDAVSNYDAFYGQLARLVANQRKVQALKA